MSEPRREELSSDPSDYLTGPTAGDASRTEGGTTRDGGVNVYGASRTGGGDDSSTSSRRSARRSEG